MNFKLVIILLVTLFSTPLFAEQFQASGFSFQYPDGMKIEQESIFGITHLSIEADDSTLFMLQIYPDSHSPDKVRKDLLESLRQQFATFRARFPEKPTEPCRRKIGGEEYEGIKLMFSLFGMPHVNEIYSMKKHGKTAALVFHYAVEDQKDAFPRFKKITSSFQ